MRAGLRIINAEGKAPTAEEVAAANTAHAMFGSRSVGVFRYQANGATVEYHAHKRLALTTSGGMDKWWGPAIFPNLPVYVQSIFAEDHPLGPALVVDRAIDFSITTVSVGSRFRQVLGAFAGLPTVFASRITGDGLIFYVDATDPDFLTVSSVSVSLPSNIAINNLPWNSIGMYSPPQLQYGANTFPVHIVVTGDGVGTVADDEFSAVDFFPSIILAGEIDVGKKDFVQSVYGATLFFITLTIHKGNPASPLVEFVSGSIEWKTINVDGSDVDVVVLSNFPRVSPSPIGSGGNEIYLASGTFGVAFDSISVQPGGEITFVAETLSLAYAPYKAFSYSIDHFAAHVSGAKTAIRRERAKLATESTALIDRLKAGALPASIDRLMKTTGTQTVRAKGSVAMSVLQNSLSIDGNVFTRTVQLRYQNGVDGDGQPVYVDETFSGTATLPAQIFTENLVDPLTGGLTPVVTNRKNSYVNYPLLLNGTEIGQADTADNILQSANYQKLADYYGLSFNDMVRPDVGAAAPFFFIANGDHWETLSGVDIGDFTLTIEAPDYLKTFLKLNKAVDQKTIVDSGTEGWISQRFRDGEIVYAIPVLWGSTGGTVDDVPFSLWLNQYETATPAHPLAKTLVAKVVGRAAFKWSADSLSFSPLGWSAVLDGEGNELPDGIIIDPPYSSVGMNMVFFSRGAFAWSDIKLIADEFKAGMDAADAGGPASASQSFFARVRAAVF